MKYEVTVHIGGRKFRKTIEAVNADDAIYRVRGRIEITAEPVRGNDDIMSVFKSIFK